MKRASGVMLPVAVGCNRRWRITEEELSDELRDEILDTTKRYGRMNWFKA